MENKKTTELLDQLGANKISDVDKTSILLELQSREPFASNYMDVLWRAGEMDKDLAGNLLEINARIDSLKNEIKLLKRHKHDEKSGDVMVRI